MTSRLEAWSGRLPADLPKADLQRSERPPTLLVARLVACFSPGSLGEAISELGGQPLGLAPGQL